ncbi:MAG: hypothetical protein J5929_09535 [Eubacterium sp.]|nr:hypothetical protein [Eubacterium sp.]
MSDRKCCGNCRYHRPEKHEEDRRKTEWSCDNAESDNWGCFTEYNDKCEDWEGRDGCQQTR